jgi:two-component system LytT family response regulator
MHVIREPGALEDKAPAPDATLKSEAEKRPCPEGPDSRNPRKKIRTLIADDQLLAREVLRHLLKHEPDVEIVGTPCNGRETVAAINELQPDLVFLDVQMPELDGFGVVDQIGKSRMPAVVFVTADKEFALKAFDVPAVDYILKPCGRERFRTALQRARDQIYRHETSEIHDKLNALLDDIRIEPKHPERIAVKSDGRILFLRLSDLDWIEAADNYVNLHAGSESHMLRETLTALESRLPSDRFLRINRSTIVNIDQIKELHPMFHGEYSVVLRNGARLTLTRGYREKLTLLGIV